MAKDQYHNMTLELLGRRSKRQGQNAKRAAKDTKRWQLDALLDDMGNTGIRIVTATAREIAEVEGKEKQSLSG